VRDFAVFLLGLRVTQPTEYRRVVALRRLIHRRIAPLRAEILRSAEPVPFSAIDRGAFTPLRPGTAWGRVFDCAWLRVTGEVPASANDPVVLLGIRGEGLVHDAEGTVLDAVSTVFQQADLPHAGGKYRVVRGADTTTGSVELYADVAYNGFILYEVGRAVYHGAWLAERDETAHALYYDYLTLLVLADATDEASLRTEVFSALRRAYAHARRGELPQARAVLAPLLARPSGSAFTYTAIGHGHLDMAWLWPLRETHRKAARTYARQLRNLAEEPEYLYGTSQPQQLAWIKRDHPELFDRIKEAVAAGRMELQGAFWIEPDTNLPSGESLIRQALFGRRFYEREFGIERERLRVCWLPDTFGYSGNLPQILRGTGMSWFQTIKLAWNKVNDFPFRTFHWEGIDGSRVLVHMPPEGDYNSRGAADGLLKGIRQYPERDLGTALLVFGAGDGGGGPGEVHLELQRRERSLQGLPHVVPGTADAFFRTLEQREIPHVHRGELYLETHQGTYTTAGHTKRFNRRCERLLHDAEALAVISRTDCRGRLEPLWEAILLNQFHDIIPGSSIARVNREARETYERVAGELEAAAGGMADSLPRGGPSALNLTSLPRREHIRVGGRWQLAQVAPYAAATLSEPLPSTGLVASGDRLANDLLSLRFGEDGSIVSCRDADGVEHAGDGLNRLVLHEDPYLFPFNAWDIDPRYLDKQPAVLTPVQVDSMVDGPKAVRRTRYRGPRVEVVQTVVVEVGSPLVTCHTRVHWRQKHRMLRAEFRPSHYGDTVRCEIQFGHIERATTESTEVERAQFEVCAHRWIAVGDERAGFALVNDGKYGHRAKSGLLSLNLLRAPTFPDKGIDRGDHEFTYGFLPLPADDLQPAIHAGHRLNNPLRVSDAAPFPSVVASADPGVLIDTLKPAEDGDGVVLRLYEALGRATTTSVSTTIPHERAVETDMLESDPRPVDLSELAFTPFQIRTIVLRG